MDRDKDNERNPKQPDNEKQPNGERQSENEKQSEDKGRHFNNEKDAQLEKYRKKILVQERN